MTQTLTLVVEHQYCAHCRSTFTAVNPKLLLRYPFARANGNFKLPTDDAPTEGSTQEILHITTELEQCPNCFEPGLSPQFDLFERPEPQPLFVNGENGVLDTYARRKGFAKRLAAQRKREHEERRLKLGVTEEGMNLLSMLSR